MRQKLKIIKPLVIGIGIAGKRHLEAQLSLGIITGVYTTNLQTAKSLKNKTNVIIFDNLNKALDWSNLVHVCTPDDKHTEFVALALKKKKTVLCEKSFTTSLKDALYLQKLAHKNNCLLIIGQNYRLTPTFFETKKRIIEGSLGTITKIETTYLHDVNEYQQRKPVRKNWDFLYIGGSHAIDLACWIAGEPVAAIQAKAKKNAENLPASYSIVLEFTSGLCARIELDASSSRLKSGTDLIVEGEKGKLISHNKSDQLQYYKNDNNHPQSIVMANNQTLTTALEIKIVDEFLSGKQSSYWPLPDADEALNTMRILDNIQKKVSL